MTSTAFVSDYFEKRPPGAGPRMNQGTAAEPAFNAQKDPPAFYHQGRSSKKAGRGTIIVSSVLRLLTFLFAVVGLAILATSEGRFGIVADDGTQTVKTIQFTILRAFRYLFSACCIVAVYSLATMVISLVSLCVSALAHSNILLAIIFVCDQVLAYVLISAGAAGANGVMVSINDENLSGFQRILTCERMGLTGFCTKAAISVGVAFAAFLFLAITSVLSARLLFRH